MKSCYFIGPKPSKLFIFAKKKKKFHMSKSVKKDLFSLLNQSLVLRTPLSSFFLLLRLSGIRKSSSVVSASRLCLFWKISLFIYFLYLSIYIYFDWITSAARGYFRNLGPIKLFVRAGPVSSLGSLSSSVNPFHLFSFIHDIWLRIVFLSSTVKPIEPRSSNRQ